MVRMFGCVALALSLALAGCGDDGDPVGTQTPTLLTSGVPLTTISGGNGSQKMYRIPVTAGATRLLITTTGPDDNSDIDMYVKRGTPPTTSSEDDDCDSITDFTTTETCDIPNPAAGDWFIMLHAYTNYSGVTLTATVTRP